LAQIFCLTDFIINLKIFVMPTKKAAAKKTTPGKKQQPSGNGASADPALRELFVDEIRDIYYAEKKLVTALPKMQKAASTTELQDAIGEHIAVTEEHVARLEEIFGLLGETARGKKCEAMEGLIKEAEGVVEDTEEGTATRDVAVILAAQKVEHYEIATYGGLATLASTLGLDDIASILNQTLEEEKQADETLTEVAENSVNYEAAMEEESEE
jgi:ferritin-like metal-binding protein YciE